MITLGIVGVEAAKLTRGGVLRAKVVIDALILASRADRVVSGRCHLGGIDELAIQRATVRRVPWREFPPEQEHWDYYKKRNLQIVEASTLVVCITVTHYHPGYTKDRYPMCYHCRTDTHVKSGGCWTVKHAVKQGKTDSHVVVIEP